MEAKDKIYIKDLELIAYHGVLEEEKQLGQIDFKEITPFITLVTYQIEFTAKVPFVSQLILANLKAGITLGFEKIAKSIV